MDNGIYTKACKHCKAQIPTQAKKCMYCKKSQSGMPVWLIVILCILGLFFMVGVLGTGGTEETKEETKTEEKTEKKEETKEEETKTEEPVKVETEQEYKKTCAKYSYKEVFRNSDNYKGKRAYVKGEVIQVLTGNNSYALRVDMTKDKYGYYDDTIYITMPMSQFNGRILEDDIIEFWGEWDGLESYESVLGSEVTLPKFKAKYASLSK